MTDTEIMVLLELNKSGCVKTRESSRVEFKQSFDWGNNEEYAKIITSFANNKGGVIVFGVMDKPRTPCGLSDKRFENRNPESISEFLKGKFSSPAEFESGIVELHGKEFGYILVHPAKCKPIICTSMGKDLKDGAIYFRNGARSELIDAGNLLSMLEDEKEKERRKWRDIFEKIATTGVENAAILNIGTGEISGSGGTVIIDESLLPKIKFVKDGDFTQKDGAPTLKIIGEVTQSSRIVEKEVSTDKKYKYGIKNIGVELGFENKHAQSNAQALVRYYGLQKRGYMYEFNTSDHYKPKRYSQKTIDFLKEKMAAGEFIANHDSDRMKEIRKTPTTA